MGGHDVMNDRTQQFEQRLRDELRGDDPVVAALLGRLDAMRLTSPAELAPCCRANEPGVRQACDLERRRLQVLAELTRLIAPGTASDSGLSGLAARLLAPLNESVSPVAECAAPVDPLRTTRATQTSARRGGYVSQSGRACNAHDASPLNTTA